MAGGDSTLTVGRFLDDRLRRAVEEVAAARRRLAAAPGGALDPEAVRHLRLAFRAVRYDLDALGEVDPAVAAPSLTAHLREVGAPLGELRDAEVLDKSLERALAERPDVPAARTIRRLANEVQTRRRAPVDDLLAHGACERAVDALDDFRVAVVALPSAAAPVAPLARRALALSWRTLQGRVDKSRQSASDARLHHTRIAAKRLLYLSTAFDGIAGPADHALLDRLTAFQQNLGRQHDHVTASAWLESVGERHPDVRELAAALAEDERARADACAAVWLTKWWAAAAKRPAFAERR